MGPAPRGEGPHGNVEVTPPPFSTGIARYMAGDLPGAEVAFRQALKEFDAVAGGGGGGAALGVAETKQRLDSTYNLGVVLGELNRHDEGAVAYARTLELEPTHEAALLNLAGIHAAAKQWPEAEGLLQRAIAAHPKSQLTLNFAAQFNTLEGNPRNPFA